MASPTRHGVCRQRVALNTNFLAARRASLLSVARKTLPGCLALKLLGFNSWRRNVYAISRIPLNSRRNVLDDIHGLLLPRLVCREALHWGSAAHNWCYGALLA